MDRGKSTSRDAFLLLFERFLWSRISEGPVDEYKSCFALDVTTTRYWDSQYELAEALVREGDSVSRFDLAVLSCCKSRRARKGRKMPETNPK
jgi:hypothetical protein